MAKDTGPSRKERRRAAKLRRAALNQLAGGKKPRRLRIGARLRNYFLTGLIIVGPVAITIQLILWVIGWVDDQVKPLLPDVERWVRQLIPDQYITPELKEFSIPGLGLLFSILGLMLIGALAANLFGRTIISYGEMMVGRMPVVRNIYRALKQIFETVLSQRGTSFQQVGLIEYPRRGLYSIVFISTETKGEIQHKRQTAEDLVSVFLPTTPNPTSGYLLFVPRSDIQFLDMSVEDAAKMVISAGLVVPNHEPEGAAINASTPPPPVGAVGNAEVASNSEITVNDAGAAAEQPKEDAPAAPVAVRIDNG